MYHIPEKRGSFWLRLPGLFRFAAEGSGRAGLLQGGRRRSVTKGD